MNSAQGNVLVPVGFDEWEYIWTLRFCFRNLVALGTGGGPIYEMKTKEKESLFEPHSSAVDVTDPIRRLGQGME